MPAISTAHEPDRPGTHRIAQAESERGEIVLLERRSPQGPAVLELRVNGVFVMDTQETSSEVALAEAALDTTDAPARVLVGGLGLGFTAARVLADPRVRELTVVEIEAALLDWMRDGTIAHGPELIADQRLRLVNADIATAITEVKVPYDLVLLDVDNGPGYLVFDTNAALYRTSHLVALRRALTPNGTLVIWSSSPAPELAETMASVFGMAEERAYPVHPDTHPTEYFLYSARNLTPAD